MSATATQTTVQQPTMQPPIPAAPVFHQPLGQVGQPVARAGAPTVTSGQRPWGAILAVLAVFVALIGTFVLYLMTSSKVAQVKQVDQQIADLQTELTSPPLAELDQRLGGIQAALQGYKAAHQKKTNFMTFAETLPRLVPSDMRMSSLVLDDKGAIRVTAKGTVFETAGKALLSFRQSELMTNVKLTNVSLTEKEGVNGINFDLEGIVPGVTQSTTTPNPSPTANPASGTQVQ